MQSGVIDEALVDAIYGAAAHDGGWAPALDRLRTLLGSCETSITVFDRPNFHFTQETACRMITQENRDAYSRHYFALDPKVPILARRKPGYLFNDVDHFDDSFVGHNPFYQEFSRWIGTRHTLDMLMQSDGERDVYLAAMRSPRQGAYDTRAASTFYLASRHFLRAIEFKEKLHLASRAESALDRLAVAVLVVGREGRLLCVNRAAETIFEMSSELQLCRGKLCARSTTTGNLLRAAIERALGGTREPSVLRVPVAENDFLVLWSAPLPDTSRLSQARTPAALLILADPLRIRLDPSELAPLYGLTRAEAELAIALGNGETLNDFARRRGVKLSTGKTQLLAVLGKTGFHRQADLTRALAAMSRPLI